MIAKRAMLKTAVFAAAMGMIGMWAGQARAANTLSAADLTLSPKPAVATEEKAAEKATPSEAAYMDAAAETPNIHGFANVTVTTSYTTPRGLVVENQGIVVQPIVGIVVPLGDIGFMKKAAVVAGIWNCITYHQEDPKVGGWNEMDVFVSYGFEIVDKVHFDITYGAWNFPQSSIAKPETEHNLEFKLSYDDTGMIAPDVGIRPYVNVFYAVYGSSTVVLGDEGDTGYVELGISPTFKTGMVTWSFPTYVSVGPSEYWDRSGDISDNNFGVFSTTVQGSIPLTSIIPARFGYWHLDAGVQYYYLANGALLDAGTLLSGNDDRNVFRGYVTLGMNF